MAIAAQAAVSQVSGREASAKYIWEPIISPISMKGAVLRLFSHAESVAAGVQIGPE
jgi:hypothetical protein